RSRRRGFRDVLLDSLDETLRGEPIAERHSVADGLRARAPMTDDGDPGEPEERRAAVLRVIDAPLESPQRAPRQQRSDAHRAGARQLVAQQALDDVDKPLADFQRDVAREAVADDDVGVAAVDVA